MVNIDGQDHHIRDLVNPPGAFSQGIRQREYSAAADCLPLSGRLIPEFSGRRNIRDMFSQKPSMQPSNASTQYSIPHGDRTANATSATITDRTDHSRRISVGRDRKRSSQESSTGTRAKRPKSSPSQMKAQKNLRGFFFQRPSQDLANGVGTLIQEPISPPESASTTPSPGAKPTSGAASTECTDIATNRNANVAPERDECLEHCVSTSSTQAVPEEAFPSPSDTVHDPVQAKESWSKLFTKPVPPRCEGHDEPCVSLLTKKPGINLGRSFWMCPRPLGPTGAKEKNTQWRCQTFIWSSDWNARCT